MLLFNLSIVVLLSLVVFASTEEKIHPKLVALRHKKGNKHSKKLHRSINDVPTVEDTTIIQPSTIVEDLDVWSAESTTTEGSVTDPTTPNPEPAFCDESLYTKDDLKRHLEALTNELHVSDKIKESYESSAVNIKNKYLDKIAAFRKRFQDRPLDLLPIIGGWTALKNEILNTYESQSAVATQYSEMESQYNEKQSNYMLLFKNFKRVKSYCEFCKPIDAKDNDIESRQWQLSSNIQQLMQSTEYDKNTYFCGTYDDVRNKIELGLLSFIEDQQEFYNKTLKQDDAKFEQQIEDMKNVLISEAYNDFQQTVYSMLDIQSRYEKVNATLKDMDFKESLNNVKQNIAEIEPLLVTFRIKIKELSAFCKKCADDNMLSRTAIQTSQSKDLLDDVMETELQNLQKTVDQEYASSYNELNEALKEMAIENYLELHKEIHARVDAAVKAEINQLENLEQNVTTLEQEFKKYSQISQSIIQTLTDIRDNIKFIDTFINV